MQRIRSYFLAIAMLENAILTYSFDVLLEACAKNKVMSCFRGGIIHWDQDKNTGLRVVPKTAGAYVIVLIQAVVLSTLELLSNW